MVVIETDLNGKLIVPQVLLKIIITELKKNGIITEDGVIDLSTVEELLQANEDFLIQWFLLECFPHLDKYFPEYPVVSEEVAEFIHDMVTGFVPAHGGYPFSRKTEINLGDGWVKIYTFGWLPAPGEEKSWMPYQLVVLHHFLS